MKPAVIVYLIGVSILCAAAIRCLPQERKRLFHGLAGALLIVATIVEYTIPR